MTTVKACEREMAKLEAKRKALRRELGKLNARFRIWSEKLRGATRREERRKMKAESGVAVAVDRPKVRVKAKAKAKAPRGRPMRWPGLCHACMRRHVGEVGGPRHLRHLRARTQAYIKAGKR